MAFWHVIFQVSRHSIQRKCSKFKCILCDVNYLHSAIFWRKNVNLLNFLFFYEWICIQIAFYGMKIQISQGKPIKLAKYLSCGGLENNISVVIIRFAGVHVLVQDADLFQGVPTSGTGKKQSSDMCKIMTGCVMFINLPTESTLWYRLSIQKISYPLERHFKISIRDFRVSCLEIACAHSENHTSE